jgi:ribosomal protein S4
MNIRFMEIKVLDLVLDLQFTSSASLARDYIKSGRVSVAGEIITEPNKLVLVDERTMVCFDGVVLGVGNHPTFVKAKYGIR